MKNPYPIDGPLSGTQVPIGYSPWDQMDRFHEKLRGWSSSIVPVHTAPWVPRVDFWVFRFCKRKFSKQKIRDHHQGSPKKGAQSLLVCCFVPKLWGKTLIQSWEGVGGLSLVSFTS